MITVGGHTVILRNRSRCTPLCWRGSCCAERAPGQPFSQLDSIVLSFVLYRNHSKGFIFSPSGQLWCWGILVHRWMQIQFPICSFFGASSFLFFTHLFIKKQKPWRLDHADCYPTQAVLFELTGYQSCTPIPSRWSRQNTWAVLLLSFCCILLDWGSHRALDDLDLNSSALKDIPLTC